MKKNNNMMIGALAILVIASVIGIVQLKNESMGLAVYEETGAKASHYCICHIAQFDYYGNQMGEMTQELRVRTTTPLTSNECEMRCDSHFGRASVSKSVWGEVV